MRRHIVSFLAALGITLSLVTPALAVEYGGIGGVPANPDPANPRTSSIFVYSLAGGASEADGVRIANNAPETKTIEVYAVDSEIASGGAFACRQKVDPKNEVGKWISFTTTEVTLKSGENQVLPFQVNVPEGTSVGEHDGCLVIQEKGAVATPSGNGLMLNVRSAIRVVITVPGDIKKELAIDSLSTKASDEKHILTVRLQNKGNVSLDTDVQVEVRNIFNRLTFRDGGVFPILVQDKTFELNFEMKHSFWGGLYRVRSTARYNSDPTVGIGQTSTAEKLLTSPSRYIFVMPQPGAILVYLAIVLGAVLGVMLLLKRRKRSQHVKQVWQEYTVRKQDTLHKLADKHQTPWKIIVKANKLKAPYKLEAGSTLLLPPLAKKTRITKKASETKDADESGT